MENSDLIIAAFSGGASGSILGMLASFLAHQWRVRTKRNTFEALTEFISRHAERSVASINLDPETTSDLRLVNRLRLCMLGDVISPKELVELSAESGAIGEKALTISLLVRNSDVVIQSLIAHAERKDIEKQVILNEAIANMKHLQALSKALA